MISIVTQFPPSIPPQVEQAFSAFQDALQNPQALAEDAKDEDAALALVSSGANFIVQFWQWRPPFPSDLELAMVGMAADLVDSVSRRLPAAPDLEEFYAAKRAIGAEYDLPISESPLTLL